jgi:hypothetical protein
VNPEVQQLRVERHRVHGSDSSRRSNCDTADGNNGEIVNCVNVRASGINSLYATRREVTCRALYTQHVTIYCNSACRCRLVPEQKLHTRFVIHVNRALRLENDYSLKLFFTIVFL